MKTSWFIGLLFLFLILTPIFGIIEQDFLLDGESGVFATLLTPPWESTTSSSGGFFGGFINAVVAIPEWLGALWKLFTFGYACFTGSWAIMRYFLCCIPIGIIITLILDRMTAKTT